MTVTFTWTGLFEVIGIVTTAVIIGGVLRGLWVMARWGK